MSRLATGLLFVIPAALAASGSGHSTRYWDCCKPSCAWPGKASVGSPVRICSANNSPLADANAASGCNGGQAFTCANNLPWAVNDSLAYGFAATAINGGSEASWCCACYKLTFTSGPVAGKVMIVQSVNTGSDISNNQFDLLMPGGGVGLFDGCTPQYGGIPGAQYGGVSSRSQCDQMPAALKAGCNWRFDWFLNADNPTFNFEQVRCPVELTAITGCVRSDDGSFPPPGNTGGGGSPTTTLQPPPSTTTNPSGASQTHYGQCGGQGWAGPSQCQKPYTCQAQSQWYSQCL